MWKNGGVDQEKPNSYSTLLDSLEKINEKESKKEINAKETAELIV